MSSKDLKTRFDSQFARMNCQIFSCGLSSGERGGQRQERDVAWSSEVFGAVPSGLIEDQNGVRARRDLGSDLVEMKLHGLGVAGRQHERRASSEFGADRTEHIGRLRALIVDGAGARTFCGPAVGELVLLTHPHLVLEPHLYGCAGRKCRADCRHALGEVFLNDAMASASCL